MTQLDLDRTDYGADDAPTSASLHERYLALRSESPRLFARDAAARLGCSEAELVASLPHALRLAPRWPQLFQALPALGDVKTITRNAHAVIEKWGRFEGVEVGEAHAGQVVGEDIDLRIFPRRIASGFFVSETGPRGARDSLQLFDEHGDSAHKVYAESSEAALAMRTLAADLLWEGSSAPLAVVEPPPPERREAVSDETASAFREAWDAMTDTHDFFGLLRRFRLARVRGLEIAGGARAVEVRPDSLAAILEWAAAFEVPLMVFVGSRAVIQIHTGLIRRVEARDGYLNVLDRGFNLHVKDGSVARAFVVRKPTSDGAVTSLELYDARGETIGLVFSKRKPGQIERSAWRDALAGLPLAEAT